MTILPDKSWNTFVEFMCSEVCGEFLRSQLEQFAGNIIRQAGSFYNVELGENLFTIWKQWGWPIVQKQDFFVHLPTGPAEEGPLNEIVLIDAYSKAVIHSAQNYVEVSSNRTNFKSKKIPCYQAYSCSGEANSCSFVYLNYGRLCDLVDFDRIHCRNFATEPSKLCNSQLIAVIRLGKGSRKAKVENLLKHCGQSSKTGVNNVTFGQLPAGIIFYPDPYDVIGQGEQIYPHGSGLPGDAPVFGHVNMKHSGGGDPCCTIFPSSDHIYRTDALVPGEALTPMPVQPIGYDDAKIILSHLDGPSVPQSWENSLATRIGPSEKCQLNMAVRNRTSTEMVKCTNVIAIMPGHSEESDQYIIFGNHRDAWIQGACDPGSGNVIMQQIAKLFGQAYIEGFRPRRTLVMGSWDGEEFSLLGSTHFANSFKHELIDRAVAYINSDCPIKGHGQFSARCDSMLSDLVLQVTKDIKVDPPVNNDTLFDQWFGQGTDDGKEPRISAVGGGSDHIPFAYRLGIPSMYPEYWPDHGLYNTPVYHTAYDSVDVAERFTDPSLNNTGPLPRHRLMCKLIIRILMHLLCASRVPLSPLRMANNLLSYWHGCSAQMHERMTNLLEMGIHLEWIQYELDKFKSCAEQFEHMVLKLESNSDNKFPSHLNRILIGLNKHCIASDTAFNQSALKNIVQGISQYKTEYFPYVKLAFDQLAHCSSSHNQKELDALKFELSSLAHCFKQMSHWLSGGLTGALF